MPAKGQRSTINLEAGTKRCSVCKKWLELSLFWKDKHSNTGYLGRCVVCIKEQRETPEYKAYRKQYEQGDKFKAYHENYEKVRRKRNKERESATRRARENKRRQTDILFKLKQNCSRRIRYSLAKNSKKTIEFLGCSIEFLKQHLESKFKKDMTWDNYGEWEIDHIYPVSKALNEQHLLELFHYTNLQPLWSKENREKFNKVIDYVTV